MIKDTLKEIEEYFYRNFSIPSYYELEPGKRLGKEQWLEELKKLVRQQTLEEAIDNLLGTVIKNCTGYIERDGVKLWQLDMDSLESDLKLQALKDKSK